jgi:hypothetical protein
VTIPGESASVAEPRVRTTLPKGEKVDRSWTEEPTALALVARPGGKASDDTPFDDDPNLLNFAAVVPWIGTGLIQGNWMVRFCTP